MRGVTNISPFRAETYASPAKEEIAKARAWTVGVLVLIGVAMIYGWQSSHAETERLFRAQFHIPDDVAFAETRYPRRGSANGLEAIVQFDQKQFAAYMARLDDPRIWKPALPDLPGPAAEPPYSPRALRWAKLPGPALAGNRRVRWGNLSRDQVYMVKNGRAFCLALRQPAGKRKSDWSYAAPKGYDDRFPLDTPAHLDRYNALACSELGRSERPRALVQGVLDFDTRTLHMIVR